MRRMFSESQIKKLVQDILLANEAIQWADEMKDYIGYDNAMEKLTFDGGFTTDGVAIFYDEIDCDLNSICDYEGNAYFPSLENQAGKVVKVNSDETGFEYGEVSGGTKLYKHDFNDANDYYLTIISTNPNQITAQNFDSIMSNAISKTLGSNIITGSVLDNGDVTITWIGYDSESSIVRGGLDNIGALSRFTDTVTPL